MRASESDTEQCEGESGGPVCVVIVLSEVYFDSKFLVKLCCTDDTDMYSSGATLLHSCERICDYS